MASARAGRGPRRRGSSGAGEPGARHQTTLLGGRRGCEWHAGRSRYFRTRVRGTRGLRRVDSKSVQKSRLLQGPPRPRAESAAGDFLQSDDSEGETMDLNKVI